MAREVALELSENKKQEAPTPSWPLMGLTCDSFPGEVSRAGKLSGESMLASQTVTGHLASARLVRDPSEEQHD